MPRTLPQRCIASVFLLLLVTASAQTPSPNADILKMIQASLPESSIVDKIRENSGHWDTSIDALIALKQAGATDAEIKALTAPSATAQPTSSIPPRAATVVAGGTLLNTREGDPYLQFPEKITTVFPDGTPSNRAFLISYQGKPAIRIPAEYTTTGGTALSMPSSTAGNFLVTRDSVIFDPYLLEFRLGSYPKNGRYEMKKDAAKEMAETAMTLPRADAKPKYQPYAQNRETIFSKKYHYNIGWHFAINGWSEFGDYPQCISVELEDFIAGLLADFDLTIGPVLAAAGISDADKQLSPAAHYSLISPADYPKYAALYQARLDHTPPPKKNGSGWADFSEVAQVAGAGVTALQQSNAGGNTVAAQNNAMAQYNQNVASIESGGTAAPYIPPAPAAAPVPVATPTSQPAAKSGFHIDTKKSGGSVSGGNSGTAAPPVAYQPPPSTPIANPGTSMASQFAGQPGVTKNCTEAAGVAQCNYYKNGAWLGTEAVCPSTGIFIGGGYIKGDVSQTFEYPCVPGTPSSQIDKTGNPNTNLGSSSGAGSSGSGSSGDFVTGLSSCATDSYVPLPGGTDPFLTFYNGCHQPIRILWIIGPSGTPRSHSFATDESFNQTGSDQNDVITQGGVTYYACPADHPIPVDSNGNQILTPKAPYQCAKHS
jgi:hypothetical protein